VRARDCHRAWSAGGVTLLELLLALALLGAVTAGIYGMVAGSANAARNTAAFLLVQAQVRAALDGIVDEARWASGVNAAQPTCVTLRVPEDTPFSAHGPYSVTFAYDAAQDAVVRRETADPGTPGCPLSGAADVIAHSVVQPDGSDGLSFEYFDAAGNSLGSAPADTGRVARIRVLVTAAKDGASRTFAGDVALRAR